MHVSDIPAAGSIESTLRQAATNSIVADADFATDEATTLANLATRNTNIRPDLRPLYLAAREAVKIGFHVLGATVMTGGSLATIYAAVPGDWAPGFPVTL